MSFADLPAVNACLNGLSAVFLGMGYWFIRRKNVAAHRKCMVSAFVVSTLFLACYITYHGYLAYYLHRGPTRFIRPAGFRPIYLMILGTHTLLAIAIVPLAVMTLWRALKQRFDRHKRIARLDLAALDVCLGDRGADLPAALPDFPPAMTTPPRTVGQASRPPLAGKRMGSRQAGRLPHFVQVAVHPSQFPENVRADLRESLRTRCINHKFHYDSIRQTQQWLALHQAYSPSRTDPDCAAAYDRAFAAAASRVEAPRVHLIGLGCGGGQKDTRLLKLLQEAGRTVFYTPSDVSTAMVLVAQQAATAVIPAENCFPLVCDLASADDLPVVLDSMPIATTARLVTFFGMIPNFEPGLILPKLAALLRPADHLLFSANLAPGSDYAAGVQRILPLYDNALTRDWLMTFLLDLGVAAGDGELRFVIEDDPAGSGLKRVAAYFYFGHRREICVDAHRFEFAPGESIRLFFSYRHTPALVRELLGRHGLKVLDQWIANSGEEGVFLVARA